MNYGCGLSLICATIKKYVLDFDHTCAARGVTWAMSNLRRQLLSLLTCIKYYKRSLLSLLLDLVKNVMDKIINSTYYTYLF